MVTWMHVRWFKTPYYTATMDMAQMTKLTLYTVNHPYQHDNKFGDELLNPDDDELFIEPVCVLPSMTENNVYYMNPNVGFSSYDHG
jgi:hypothetical protein